MENKCNKVLLVLLKNKEMQIKTSGRKHVISTIYGKLKI